MLTSPNSVTIVDYMKVADGEYIALFRTTLADAVFLDMNNNITLQDVLVNDPSNKVFHFVKNDAARFALSASKVSNGDIVKVDDTGMLHTVIDNTKLNIESGYFPFAGVIGERSFRLYNAVLAKANWKALGNTTGSSVVQYYYQFDHPSISSRDCVDFDLTGADEASAIATVHAANEAVVNSIVNEFDGYARLYSKYIPTIDLPCNVTVTKL